MDKNLPDKILPDANFAAPEGSGPVDLEQLGRMIESETRPALAAAAVGKSMEDVFNIAAADVERLAREQVDRANATLQEALSYSKVLREAGSLLCATIRAEAARVATLSAAIKDAVERFETAPAEPPPSIRLSGGGGGHRANGGDPRPVGGGGGGEMWRGPAGSVMGGTLGGGGAAK